MKKLLLIISAIILLASLALVVKAHSGRTDGAGGHTDHSTGEYHYHHGYPEHDHYDMDGDGDADCPYTFVGKKETTPKAEESLDIDIQSLPTFDFDVPIIDYPPLPDVKTPVNYQKENTTETDSGSGSAWGLLIAAALVGGWCLVGVLSKRR